MNDLMTVVDWSRWQFALTAIYHWLFVPLTLGLSVIVGVMETAYVRTGSESWLKATKVLDEPFRHKLCNRGGHGAYPRV